GAARAAVLGVSDGLVSNVCLILAVAGAEASRSAVRLAGFASLIAGALSMAAGEWISVRSQVELFEGILGRLRDLVRRDPELILDQLTDRLEEAGVARDTAQRASTELPLDEPRFLRFCANTLFGLNPDELGSPMTAAVTSLGNFAAGAAVPLVPWFITEGTAAKLASVVLTAAASLVVGAVVARRPAPAGHRRRRLGRHLRDRQGLRHRRVVSRDLRGVRSGTFGPFPGGRLTS